MMANLNPQEENRQLLLVFVKIPVPGRVKTRLAKTIGADKANEVYKQLVQSTFHTIQEWQGAQQHVWVFFDGLNGIKGQEESWIWLQSTVHKFGGHQASPPWRLIPQSEGDLGDRLIHAFSLAFQSGFQQVAVIGSDCPALQKYDLDRAFSALGNLSYSVKERDTNDVHSEEKKMVLGPAEDGGYYLLGLNSLEEKLFKGIPWSTAEVANKTLLIASKNNFTVITLRSLSDLDTETDWMNLQYFLQYR